MEASSLLDEGITLMLFGMGFVFVFLTLLVMVTSLMSWIIIKYEKNVGAIPDDGVPSPTAFIPRHGPLVAQPERVTDDKTVISILAAAVHKYRSRHK
ncbi:MAG: sodium pump decarboxylase subunit gamma [Methylophaga sp.]|nr:MAG: sodium pump decarboxylase subunit gamma [Methylophaga sp.]